MKSAFTIFITTLFVFANGYTFNFGVKGSGNIIKMAKYPKKEFQKVSSDLALSLIIKKSNINSIVIETDDNIIDKITLFIKHKTLFISANDTIVPTKLRVVVNMVNLSEVRAYGASNIKIEEFKLNNFFLDMSGASKVKFYKTFIEILRVKANGTFDIRFDENSLANSVYIDADGAGDMLLNVKDKLRVDISGAVSVKYRGNPRIEKSIDGVASLIKIK